MFLVIKVTFLNDYGRIKNKIQAPKHGLFAIFLFSFLLCFAIFIINDKYDKMISLSTISKSTRNFELFYESFSS